MFESLDAVDWKSLRDAYGPSTATPRRIRDLASAQERKRDAALDDLSATICHQGSICAAAVAAVPFLLEIVASPEVPSRVPALQLLQGLSWGAGYHQKHGSLGFLREKSETPEWQAQVREEESWVRAIHARLIAAVPAIVSVMREGSGRERVEAASLLATLADSPEALDALSAACLDPDPGLGVVAVAAIGRLEKPPPEVIEQCFEHATDDLVRFAAALQVLKHQRANSSSECVEELLEQLRVPNTQLRKAYEELPDIGSFLGDLGVALSVGPRDAAAKAFPLLYGQVKASAYPSNTSESWGVLALALRMDPTADGQWRPGALNPAQRQAIRLVADRSWRIERGVPSTFGNMADLFESAGLPRKREEIFALLAGTPEGVQTPTEASKWGTRKKRPWWKLF